MEQTFTEDKTFDKVNFKENPLPKGEYENCHFVNCDLSETDLAETRFAGCSFTGCNLSLAKLKKTVFRDVQFKDCKMLGLRFDHCSGFGLAFSFENCTLNHSSFYGLKIPKTIFKNCNLQEADFSGGDLTQAVFDNCDLQRAVFDNTILEKADLSTAYNYSIDPVSNRVKKARFSLQGIAGLLDGYDIVIEK